MNLPFNATFNIACISQYFKVVQCAFNAFPYALANTLNYFKNTESGRNASEMVTMSVLKVGSHFEDCDIGLVR